MRSQLGLAKVRSGWRLSIVSQSEQFRSFASLIICIFAAWPFCVRRRVAELDEGCLLLSKITPSKTDSKDYFYIRLIFQRVRDTFMKNADLGKSPTRRPRNGTARPGFQWKRF